MASTALPFALPMIALAQSADVQGGLDVVGQSAGLGSEDPRLIVARLIRTGISLLGVVAVVIVLYGGFVWMTAAGNEENVAKAKKILIGGGIGLMIILMSWSIVSFVMSSILGATGAGGSGGTGGGGGAGGGSALGGGSGSAFVVTGVKPAGEITIRNPQVRVTFSKNVDPASIAGAFTVKNTLTGAVIDGTPSVSGNVITFKPTTPCSTGSVTRCFDASTQFTVTLTTAIKNTSAAALTCPTSRPCTGTFTTGTIIDETAPTARLTDPTSGQRIAANSSQNVQVIGTDDVGVASATFLAGSVSFDEVPASGTDPKNVTISTSWDTSNIDAGNTINLSSTITDLAGNTAEDSVSVMLSPASCQNNILDSGSGETGIDCGGDPTNINYCGACDGSVCTASTDCQSGSCVNGTCKAMTVIRAVSPLSGAPGTYVTISGNGFGATPGKVFFATSGAPIEAQLAPCDGGWTDRQVIVVVPAGTGNGPISIVRADATDDLGRDATGDVRGPLIANFVVDAVIHPNLCSLSAMSAKAGDSLTLIGAGFGANRTPSGVNASTIAFGNAQTGSSYPVWGDTSAQVVVPVLSTRDGLFGVRVVSGTGVSSNSISLRFTSAAAGSSAGGTTPPSGTTPPGGTTPGSTIPPSAGGTAGTNTPAPSLLSINPGQGGIGRYVSLEGANFGTAKGTVKFKNTATGDIGIASLDFPAACGTVNPWSPTSVRFIVPGSSTAGTALLPGAYTISMTTAGGQNSNTIPFTISTTDDAPNVCGIIPGTGVSGDVVKMVGDHFGSTKGAVTFSSSVTSVISSWSNTEVKAVVPPAAQSGNVRLVNAAGVKGNDVPFSVSSPAVSLGAVGGGYAWSFSSGSVPKVPRIVSECSQAVVSSVPNIKFTDTVCVNAVVYAEFTVPMNQATLGSAVKVERCSGGGSNPCSTAVSVTGSVQTTASSFTFKPGSVFATGTTYRVTVTTDAQSADGIALPNDVQWTFLTKTDAGSCVIDSARVSPSKASLTTKNATQSFSALPTSGCVVVDPASVTWAWSMNPSFAGFNSTANPSCVGGNSSCATAEALAEGQTPVKATVGTTTTSGAGDLTIKFTDPYVTGVWPDCDSACMNAQIGASFNIPMKPQTVEMAGAVRLFSCANELCSSTSEVANPNAKCITVTGISGDCTGFSLSTVTLNPSTFYKVIVSGSVKSMSGVPLIRTNDGGDYSWIFRAREDASACAVNRVSISPASVLAKSIGDRATFSSTAYGEADSCSQSGQRLTGFSYSWSWANPIVDKNIDGNASTVVAEWLGGKLQDTSPSSVPSACTASCTAGGSVAYRAICGDGRLDATAGEECEDGNVASGDGCSASCLREGTIVPMCGNGTIDLAEDCDDHNGVDGDGCSSKCQAEGSRSVGATCGNNDIARNATTKAGEECDDGNARNGDGCSSNCTNEGTPTLASIGGAVCGDGRVDAPAESCDDSNVVNGDGCSSSCLHEGGTEAQGCGDGDVSPVFEDCDDSSQVSGDGCSSRCLFEGSSTAYTEASFCGDGFAGVGEYPACEVGVAGDGRIDPLQTAVISDGAVFEVDGTTKKALATVQVTEDSSGLSTTADLSLSCVATSDASCTNPSLYGVGSAHCCMPRPTATLFPTASSTSCRNPAIYAIFTQKMNTESFTTTSVVGATTVETNHMYLSLETGGAPVGPGPARTSISEHDLPKWLSGCPFA